MIVIIITLPLMRFGDFQLFPFLEFLVEIVRHQFGYFLRGLVTVTSHRLPQLPLSNFQLELRLEIVLLVKEQLLKSDGAMLSI